VTVEEYRARLVEGKANERHFAGVRNAWRKIVRRRARQLREAIQRRKARAKPHVVGHNQVRGGTPAERLLYAMEVAHREFRLYYSEAGTWVRGCALTNVPSNSDRSDCSWWYTMVRWCCGLEGPSIAGGFTGTILTEGKVVSREYAEKHVGVAVVFGSGDAFHCGMSTGDGPNIYQHGVPEVDTGTFDQFGAGVEVRYRAFPDTEL
jgi:hypothetical protein